MEHINEIAIKVLTDEFPDYPRNYWHYDREYKIITNALELASKLDNINIKAKVVNIEKNYGDINL
jgi:hypothetical protein